MMQMMIPMMMMIMMMMVTMMMTMMMIIVKLIEEVSCHQEFFQLTSDSQKISNSAKKGALLVIIHSWENTQMWGITVQYTLCT